jgi:hypothetical protein
MAAIDQSVLDRLEAAEARNARLEALAAELAEGVTELAERLGLGDGRPVLLIEGGADDA